MPAVAEPAEVVEEHRTSNAVGSPTDQRLSHRQFLKALGAAIGLAGAGAIALDSKKAEATYTNGTYDSVDRDLQVAGNLSTQANLSVGSTNAWGYRLYIAKAGAECSALFDATGNGYNAALYLAARDSGGNVKNSNIRANTSGHLELNPNSGNVGVGQSDPGQRLELSAGNIALDRISASGYQRYIGLAGGNGSITPGASGGSQIEFENYTDSSNAIHFLTHYSGVSHSRRMTIDRAGAVGIGTDSPDGDGRLTLMNGGLILQGSQNAELGTKVGLIKHSSGPTVLYYGTGKFCVKNNSGAGSDHLVVDQTGKVGVCTSYPSEMLDVGGNLQVSGYIKINGTVAVDTTLTAKQSYFAP